MKRLLLFVLLSTSTHSAYSYHISVSRLISWCRSTSVIELNYCSSYISGVNDFYTALAGNSKESYCIPEETGLSLKKRKVVEYLGTINSPDDNAARHVYIGLQKAFPCQG